MENPRWRPVGATAAATSLAYLLLLGVITVALFFVPYLVFST